MDQASVVNRPSRLARLAPGITALTRMIEAMTVPGLLLYRFEVNLAFFNIDYFGERLRAAIAASATPVEWVIVDASPINWVDATAVQRLDELHSELAARGITLGVASAKLSLGRAFDRRWVSQRLAATQQHRFPTLKAAAAAFARHKLRAETNLAAQRASIESTAGER